MLISAPLALLLLGLAAIAWSTRIVVDNAIEVARHHRVSDFFIGVVVLAVGSDLPELVVSLDAAMRQLGDQETDNLIIGNAIGSCFGQLGLALGLAGLMGRMTMKRPQLLRHGAILLAATALLALVGMDGAVQRAEAAALVLAFAAYIWFVLQEEGVTTGRHGVTTDEPPPADGIAVRWLRLLIGMVAVVLSAEVIVEEAMVLAVQWGVDQSLIGIAIIGIGTSLPEVVIAVAAVLKGRAGLSVGNLIGSNTLDTLLPIGLTALIVQVDFPRAILTFDLPFLAALTLLVLAFLYRRRGVRWPEGGLVLLIYCVYLAMVWRGG